MPGVTVVAGAGGAGGIAQYNMFSSGTLSGMSDLPTTLPSALPTGSSTFGASANVAPDMNAPNPAVDQLSHGMMGMQMPGTSRWATFP